MSFVIGKGLVVRGELSGEGNIELGDQFEGKICLTGSVVVLEGASIQSDISATEIVVAGAVRGNLMATEKVEFSSSGRLFGNVRSKVLVVREGARVSGRILAGAPSIPTDELAKIAEQVRREEARDLWRSP
ncbi:MAG: polymer-forming cytoskeletal protein [candidate division NC10 bacterium]|nr:polymer-forming cytoskeletal protein [candidate division NC10 bacterium]